MLYLKELPQASIVHSNKPLLSMVMKNEVVTSVKISPEDCNCRTDILDASCHFSETYHGLCWMYAWDAVYCSSASQGKMLKKESRSSIFPGIAGIKRRSAKHCSVSTFRKNIFTATIRSSEKINHCQLQIKCIESMVITFCI